jgi:hypothetical protein
LEAFGVISKRKRILTMVYVLDVESLWYILMMILKVDKDGAVMTVNILYG